MKFHSSYIMMVKGKVRSNDAISTTFDPMYISDYILFFEIFKYFKISAGIFGFRRYPNMPPISQRYPHTAVSSYILLSKQPLAPLIAKYGARKPTHPTSQG